MNVLLHTIALEPARWLPERVSRPLPELLPAIAAAGFRDLEIFEPHLTAEEVSVEMRSALAAHHLRPVVLSSYLKIGPEEISERQLEAELKRLARRVEFYGFRQVRLFPGAPIAASDTAGLRAFSERLRFIARRLTNIEVLLETHDGSLADEPALLTRVVRELALPNVGLLFQPTVFEPAAALDQFRLQRDLIRHLHLQNRNPDQSFATLREGVIPWNEIVSQLNPGVAASLEFVPLGICPPAEFDLAATLNQARAEAAYIQSSARS